jgi:integrase
MGNEYLRLVDGTSALVPGEILETEFAKDCWDVRRIPGVHYAPHKNEYFLKFNSVPDPFRSLVKDFLKFKIASGRTASTLQRCLYCLGTFFTFFAQRYPGTSILHALSEQDVDAFIMSLQAWVSTRGLRDGVQHIQHHISYLEEFLAYLERTENTLRPKQPTSRIIWPQHYPKRESRQSQPARYIPHMVLQQLDAHIHHLSPTYIPIVILLRASGWRIADVLYLKLESCLEQEGENYWLVGDIMKTRVLGHRIPITKEVATVVIAQKEWVRQRYAQAENPKGWLFPASKRVSTSPRFASGDPLSIHGVYSALATLVTNCHIRDEQGELFHFRLHAFRHTKGIELVNNGMSLLMVQQWMAHASPEMTIIYAKILDMLLSSLTMGCRNMWLGRKR